MGVKGAGREPSTTGLDKEVNPMTRTLLLLTALLAVAASAPAARADREGSRRADKDELRVTMQRVQRLAAAGPGQKLRKADRKRVEIGAHVLFAIRARARREGVEASREAVNEQLRAWNLGPAAADPNQARSYSAQEEALALRDVAEARVLFVRLAEKIGGPQKTYETIVGDYAEALPNERFQVKDVLKALPALAGALTSGRTALSGGNGSGAENGAAGGSQGGGDAASALGQALAPKPSALAKALEKTIKEFDGNPDHLPLVFPNTVTSARER
jgi:hypothetical protein